MSEKRGETFVIPEHQESSGYKPIEFTTFLLGLASSALIHMGVAPNPETGKSQKDLLLARETLDLLSMLRQKTQGNLSTEEERVFDGLLTDLRFRFIEAQKS